jgi:hypothetical protein
MIEKLMKVHALYEQVADPIFIRYFDAMSEKMLDKKLEVLRQLVDGKKPGEIEGYTDVLELMPKDGEMWD